LSVASHSLLIAASRRL